MLWKYPQQEISLNPNGKYYYCRDCGRKGEIAKTNYQAISNWNKFVEKNSQNTEKTLDKHDC